MAGAIRGLQKLWRPMSHCQYNRYVKRYLITAPTLERGDLGKADGDRVSLDEEDMALKGKKSLRDVVEKLEEFAPLSLAESWDNVGMLIQGQPSSSSVGVVLLTNDLTEAVVSEAVEKKAALIISYHPPIFSPIKKICPSRWKDRIIATCLTNKIAVYSPHTAWDAINDGVNDWLTGAFWCSSIKPIHAKSLHPKGPTFDYKVDLMVSGTENGKALEHAIQKMCEENDEIRLMQRATGASDYSTHLSLISSQKMMLQLVAVAGDNSSSIHLTKLEQPPLNNVGQGRFCILQAPISLEAAVEKIKEHLKVAHVRIAFAVGATLRSEIRTVGVCAGSGASVLRGCKAQLFVTGEMSHHDVLDAIHRGSSVVLCEHSNTERGFLQSAAKFLDDALKGSAQIYVSEEDHDPLTVV